MFCFIPLYGETFSQLLASPGIKAPALRRQQIAGMPLKSLAQHITIRACLSQVRLFPDICPGKVRRQSNHMLYNRADHSWMLRLRAA